MRVLFIVLLLVHGLIHLMGFLHAFGFSDIEAMTQPMSEPVGFMWLFSLVAFWFTAGVYLARKQWWVIPAFLALSSSQVLIILFWQDAKFGTVPNGVIFLGMIVGISGWQFHRQTQADLKEMNISESSEHQLITEDMLTSLPGPVQRWIHRIGLMDKDMIKGVHFKQKGKMKLKPGQATWSDAEAEQYVQTEKPSFLWTVKMDFLPLIHVAGKDVFINGKGSMVMKLGSLIRVAHVSNNEKVDQSALQRYLMELPLYPSMALSPYIDWESIDEHTAKATMSYNGTVGSATFYFTENGEMEKISAFRYKDNGDDAELAECIGEIKRNTMVDGVLIPDRIDISWVLEDGLFTWYKLEIVDLEFR
ncbi:DUF6920 family protein [Salimicrobium flavidum]|uniref:Uncharacterized protein n=1 Tax=Salimicrobium flavidum TaxID=570947 RepID=A0A1N7J6R8_9BACI|nr:DUF6544 family protein [Salimicrobium flavidum]SIS45002.1 hypothetical protein SAMN05421687_10431 [Salimicrobium flavidum]